MIIGVLFPVDGAVELNRMEDRRDDTLHNGSDVLNLFPSPLCKLRDWNVLEICVYDLRWRDL